MTDLLNIKKPKTKFCENRLFDFLSNLGIMNKFILSRDKLIVNEKFIINVDEILMKKLPV